jgi:hypothetical protein
MLTPPLNRAPMTEVRVMDALADSEIGTSHFLESVVCDIHWTCLHAATLRYLIQAALHRGIDLRLGAWRHLLTNNTSISVLALRYSAEMGMLPEVRGSISEFLEAMSGAMAATHAALKKVGPRTAFSRRDLQSILLPWTQTCLKAEHALASLERMTRHRLVSEYAQNAQIILAFLQEGARTDGSRLNEWGELSLPTLAQRRLHPRAVANRPCQLHVGGEALPATLQDVSRNGLGIVCSQALEPGSTVTVEFADGRKVQAKVARSQGKVTGLHLAVPLAANDPIFRAAE